MDIEYDIKDIFTSVGRGVRHRRAWILVVQVARLTRTNSGTSNAIAGFRNQVIAWLCSVRSWQGDKLQSD